MLITRTLISGIVFSLLIGYGPDSSAGSVSGTVISAQAVTLPDNTTVTVRILDVSIADIPARVIGEQLIRGGGKQLPLPFVIAFDAADIKDRLSYSVSVRIEDSNGKLLFISDTHTPVITRNSPVSGVEVVVIPLGR